MSPIHRVRAEGTSRPRGFTLALAIVLSSASLGLAQDSTISSGATNSGLPANQLVATIPLGLNIFPAAVVVSPDSQTIYVASWSLNGGSVSVVNSQSNTVTDTIPVGGTLDSLVITPDGSTLYVGSAGDASVPAAVYAISTATKTITATLNFFPEALAMNPNGKQVYVTGGPAGYTHIAIIDTATNTLKPKAIEIGKVAQQITVSPNGKTAYVAISGDFFKTVDLATNQVTADVPLNPSTNDFPIYFTFSPNGGKLYMSRGRFLFVANTSTNAVVRKDVLQPKANYGQTAITTDGNFLYQPYANLNTIVMLNTSTYKPAGTAISVDYPEAIVVAPSGSLAYVIGLGSSGGTPEGQVYVINISPQ